MAVLPTHLRRRVSETVQHFAGARGMGQEGAAEYFGGTVPIDPLLTRDRSITCRFLRDFAVYPSACWQDVFVAQASRAMLRVSRHLRLL
jgi:hypothetical protein